MTIAVELELPEASDPVRRARILADAATAETDAGRLVLLAEELCAIGRADIALDVLDRIDVAQKSRKDFMFTRASALRALGCFDEALAEISRLAEVHGIDARTAALQIAILSRGSRRPEAARYGFLSDAIHSASDMDVLKGVLPYNALSWRVFSGIRKAVVDIDKARATGMTRRWVVARLKVSMAAVVSALVFGVARLLAGGRQVHIASMGKFTRLADLVDRIDPVLRTLEADGGAKRHCLIVLFFGGYPNRQLLEMYRRRCVILPAISRVPRKLGNIVIDCLRLAGRLTELTTDYRKIGPPFLAYPKVLSFRSNEESQLRGGLEAISIDPERPFVVFGLRDMAYYQFYGDVMSIPLAQQGARASTHHRCPPLSSYVRAAEYWASRGHQVIRMGLRVSDPLPSGLDPRILDYASLDRSDELDAYLFARCWFMIAGDTGLFSGAAAFDRPSVLSDLYLVQNTMYSSNKKTRNIFVPKLIRDDRSGELLTFREEIYCNHFFAQSESCEAAGLSIVHNDPEDIIDASVELTDRLEGRYVETAEDRELQKAYHAIYPPVFRGHASKALLSAAFLRKHSRLLG